MSSEGLASLVTQPACLVAWYSEVNVRDEEQQAINASIQYWVAKLKLRKQLDGELLVRNIARNDTPEIDTSKVVLEFGNGTDVVVVDNCG